MPLNTELLSSFCPRTLTLTMSHFVLNLSSSRCTSVPQRLKCFQEDNTVLYCMSFGLWLFSSPLLYITWFHNTVFLYLLRSFHLKSFNLKGLEINCFEFYDLHLMYQTNYNLRILQSSVNDSCWLVYWICLFQIYLTKMYILKGWSWSSE